MNVMCSDVDNCFVLSAFLRFLIACLLHKLQFQFHRLIEQKEYVRVPYAVLVRSLTHADAVSLRVCRWLCRSLPPSYLNSTPSWHLSRATAGGRVCSTIAGMRRAENKHIKTYSMECIHASSKVHNVRFEVAVLFKVYMYMYICIYCLAAPQNGSKLGRHRLQLPSPVR